MPAMVDVLVSVSASLRELTSSSMAPITPIFFDVVSPAFEHPPITSSELLGN